jgi:hypothetical protein
MHLDYIFPPQYYIHTVTAMKSINFEEGGDLVLEDGRYIALPDPISPHFRPLQVFTTHCRLAVEDTAANFRVNPGQCVHCLTKPPKFIAYLATGCFLLALDVSEHVCK